MGFEKKDHKGKMILSSHQISPLWSYSSPKPPPTLHAVLFVCKLYEWPILKEWGSYTNYLEFCTGDLSFTPLFLYLIIGLYHSRCMDIYFILWIIIQFYSILLLVMFQLWPIVGSFSWLWYPWYTSIIVGFVEKKISISLLFDAIIHLRFILIFYCSSLRISHFSKES